LFFVGNFYLKICINMHNLRLEVVPLSHSLVIKYHFFSNAKKLE
jgi:hypothetical protein